jgi:hypothetical protein
MSTPSSFRRPVQPLRYRVSFWAEDQPEVSYHCALGTANARRWALHTARAHGGHCWLEYTDGTSERIDTTFGQSVLPVDAPAIGGAAKAA